MATALQFEIISLLERVGQRIGLSKSGIDFARYVLRHTQAIDWQAGNQAIVYKSVFEMARDNGISERQIYNLEQQLCETLGIGIRATANRRRYGHRDSESGRIVFGYGLDLTPLKTLLPSLRQHRAEMDAEASRWKTLKRQVAECKRTVRALLEQAEKAGLSLAAVQDSLSGLTKRILPTAPLTWLHTLLTSLQSAQRCLEAALLEWKNRAQAVDSSDPSAKNFRPDNYPTDLQTDDLSSVCSEPVDNTPDQGGQAESAKFGTFPATASPSLTAPLAVAADIKTHARFPSGAERVSLAAVWRASSSRFRAETGCDSSEQLTVATVVATANRLARRRGITGLQWSEACQVIGDYAAALCMVVIERLSQTGRVKAPTAYFAAMIRRSLSGGLRIEQSIFGLIWEGAR